MGNIVFYHSVPNNIPGVFFCRNGNWKPLFPARVLPSWIISLLELWKKPDQISISTREKKNLALLLDMVKKGIRRQSSLSLRMGLDSRHIEELIQRAILMGFITGRLRLTKAGTDFLKKNDRLNAKQEYDYSLYVPSSWCAGQRTIQPFYPKPSNLGGGSQKGFSDKN